MLPKPTRRDWSVLNSTKAILSAGTSTRPPFWVPSAKMRLAVLGGERRRQVALDLRRGRVGVHDELARDGLDADLDFHGAPQLSG